MSDIDRFKAIHEALGPDERRVWLLIGERIKSAVAQYGHFDAASDKRDLQREGALECADLLFYLAAREVATAERQLPAPVSDFDVIDGAVHEVLK